ncbi:MAG: HAE1 family hydrophobic/amphiphilic exporter-1 [Planctomycetota bacterium]|jgi:HAE1 family hydrophobic/amphiphilic exporter-1
MIKWFARHPTAANLLMMAIILSGIVALPDLQRETFPAVDNDKVSVQIIYPGATASEVEDGICRRIEDGLESITDLDEIICASSEGLAKATAIMVEGSSMTRFLDEVKSEIESIRDFPDNAEPAIVEELGRTDPVVSIAITGPDDPVALKAYAEDVKTRLLTQARIATIEITGFSSHQIRVEIPAAKLRQFNLSISDIAGRMQSQSISLPAGRIEGPEQDLLIRFDDQRKTVEEIGSIIVISGNTGASIRLSDIATISDRFALAEDEIRFNGKRAAILNISKTSAQDVITAFDDIKQFVDREKGLAPRGIELKLTQDIASVVQDRLDMIVSNGIQGLILVFLILWLFFSFRYSFWVTMGLPVTFLGALFLIPLFGITINMISMVGLLIGIGLLMDDAIVIAENIASKMKDDKPAMEAAIEGVSQVMPGILSSFATTLMVFGSLAFITGEIGQILRVMPIVLIVVVSVSLIEAFFILPNHLGHSLRHMEKRSTSRFRDRFESGFSHFRENWFGPLLDRAVEYRYLTLGLVLMTVVLAIALPASGKLKFVGFPTTEGDIVEARLLLPQGTPLERTRDIMDKIQLAAQQLNGEFSPDQIDGQNLISNLTVIYGSNPDSFETGPHVARIVVDLLAAEVRNTSLAEFRDAWRARVGNLSDVISLKFSEPSIGPGGRAIEVRLLGAELSRLKSASLDMQHWFQGFAGVTDLSDDLRPGKIELRLRLKDSAGVLGVTAKTVADQVRSAFQGITVDEFPRGNENYEVDLRLPAGSRLSIEDLESTTITSPNGSLIPLPILVHIDEERGWARINRVDRQRAITVYGDVQADVVNAQELLNLAATDLFPKLLSQYPDIRIAVRGASESSAETSGSMLRNVSLGIFGVYLLLAFQFRGYLAPITVLAVIPTALIGVMFGHWMLGFDLTMPSIIGMASLFGVVVNDSILLVVFMREERAQGITVIDAAKLAGRARFRPILLTSITTIGGLLPLLTETSLQAQILIPMAASLAFGLTSATLIGLILVPALYCILNDFDLLGEVNLNQGSPG